MIRFQGTITANAPITVTYVGHEKLPRSPHGEAVLFGSTFRGPLRHHAYHAVRHAVAESRNIDPSQVFTLRDAYMLAEGVDIRNEVQSEDSGYMDPVGYKKLRELNPLINLFGRWRVAGRLATGEMRTPADNVMPAGAGARADMFERSPEEVEYLSEADRQHLMATLQSQRETQVQVDELDAQIKKLRREAGKAADKATKDECNAQIKAHQNKIKSLRAEREGAEQSIKHPIAGYEAIAPGSELSHRMELINGTDTDLGVTLMALAEFARLPYMGGHRSGGCGGFSAHWDVARWARGQLKPESIGEVRMDGDGLHIEGDALLDAHQQFLSNLDTFDFSVHTLDGLRNREAK